MLGESFWNVSWASWSSANFVTQLTTTIGQLTPRFNSSSKVESLATSTKARHLLYDASDGTGWAYKQKSLVLNVCYLNYCSVKILGALRHAKRMSGIVREIGTSIGKTES